MRKFIAIVLLTATGLAHAYGPYVHRYYRPHGHSHWVAPLIIGGVAGAVIANQVYTPPPVVQTLPPPPYGYQYSQMWDYNCNCYRWFLVPTY